MIDTEPFWRPMAVADLETVSQIAGLVHAELPERPEALAEKFRLFPQGCFIFESEKIVLGYAISHPWRLRAIPQLDALLGALPKAPECLYLHDAALLPEGRGRSAASRLTATLRKVATAIDLHWLALVSVYGADRLWSRFGFAAIPDADLSAELTSYGSTAKYMTAPV